MWTASVNTMFPAAAILVFLLYLLLFHEVCSHLWWTAHVPQSSSSTKTGSAGLGYRPKAQTPQRKHPHSLDALWRRMKNATDNFKLNGLKHALITTTMAEARAEARRIEQERIVHAMD